MTSRIFQYLLFFSVLFLPVDSFPLGAHFLREFGARPTNLFLLLSFLLLLLFRSRNFLDKIIIENIIILTLPIFLIVGSFLLVDLDFGRNKGFQRDPAYAFFAQSGMMYWMFLSFCIWKYLLRSCRKKEIQNYLRVCAIVFVTSVIFDAYVVSSSDYDLGEKFLSWIQFYHDPFRPSGITSEPSIVGATSAFLWPFFLFSAFSLSAERPAEKIFSSLLGAILIIIGLIFGGRTFQVTILAQAFVALFLYSLKQSRKIRIFIYTTLALIIPIVVFYIYVTTIDKNVNLSSLARIGSTTTALNSFLHHPLIGIGIGQFDYYYYNFATADLFLSHEVRAWAYGLGQTRASTFNMPLRFILELGLFGVILLTIFCCYLVHKIKYVYQSQQFTDALAAILSLSGTIFFVFSQDQYGYQPLIFSLAYLFLLSKITKNKNTI